MSDKTSENIAAFALCATIILFFCTEIILNLTPPISRDALIHHLAIPKLWIKHGGCYEIPWAEYSYYPMNIDLLYVVCLYFKNDIAPKFIHLAFAIGTGLLIYLYLKLKFSRNWGLLGMVIFITTPIVVWLSTSAYIDLGMTFFTTGSVLAFIKWRDSEYGQYQMVFDFFILYGNRHRIKIQCPYRLVYCKYVFDVKLFRGIRKGRQEQFNTACCFLLSRLWWLRPGI